MIPWAWPSSATRSTQLLIRCPLSPGADRRPDARIDELLLLLLLSFALRRRPAPEHVTDEERHEQPDQDGEPVVHGPRVGFPADREGSGVGRPFPTQAGVRRRLRPGLLDLVGQFPRRLSVGTACFDVSTVASVAGGCALR